MQELDRVDQQLGEIEAVLAEGDVVVAVRAESVSGWSVAQQLDHLLLAMRASLEQVLAEPEPLPAGINLLGRVLLGYGRLPRGRGKARKQLIGRERSAAELGSDAREVRDLIARVRARPELLARREPILPHPYFGGLNARWTVRMLGVHNDHHLRIVRDIRRAA